MKRQTINELREKAQKLLNEKDIQKTKDYDSIEKLLEELSINQIELELQHQELQNAYARLDVEKERFRDLFDDAPVAYITLSETGNIFDINKAAAEIFGLPIHVFNRTSIFPYLHENSKKLFVSSVKRAFTQKKAKSETMRFVNANKKIVYTEVNLKTYYDTERNRNLCRCTLTDITERILIEEKLAKSEKRFKTIFKEDKAVKLLIDKESGQIVDANNSAFEFYGYPDLKQRYIQDINQLSEREVKKRMKNAFRRKQNYFLFEHKIASGEVRDVEVYSTPIEIDEKTFLFSIIIDVTERRKAQHALKQSEEKYRLTLANSNDTFVLLNKKGKLIFISDSSLKTTAYKPQELLGNYLKFIHPENHNDFKKILKELLKAPDKEFTVRFRHKHKQKDWVWLEAKAKNYLTNKALNAILVNIRDISEQIKKEELILKKNQELNEANAAKNKFFNIIAHDLKNPFQAIMGLTGLLHKNFDKYSNQKGKSLVNTINKAGENYYKLLENLLAWAGSQTGKIEYIPEDIIIENLFIEIMEEFSVSAKAKNIKLKYNIVQSPVVYADKNMLNTILRNLISNALKYSKPTGKILISVEKTDTEFLFSVKDNGIGMSDNTINRLFRIEEKIESLAGTNNETGTGLGLILCKEFVDKHSGTIKVTSKINKGSNFQFTIPFKC